MGGSQAVIRRAVSVAGWPLAVVAGILLVNFPALVHLVDVNPLGPVGATARHITAGLLPGRTASDPNVGWTAQALGRRAALDWLHGQVPWWNPFQGLGGPLAAEMQSAAFFPPVLLFALPDGSLYFHIAMEILAGLGTWLLLRELGLSSPMATIGGLLFSLCGSFDWFWEATMNPAAMLPFALLGVERCYRRPYNDSGWIILALALALSFYAGFPETAYLDLLFVIAWSVLRVIQTPARGPLTARLVLGGGVGLLLALPLLVPAAEYLPKAAQHVDAVGAGYEHLTATALPFFGLPYFYGPLFAYSGSVPRLDPLYWIQANGFLTAATVVLAIVGLLASRRDRGLRCMLGLVGLGAVLWIFGAQPFAELSHILPDMSRVIVQRYLAPVWELAAVIAACLGLEALWAWRRSRRALVAGSLAMLALVSVVVLVNPSARYAFRPPVRTWAIASLVWSLSAVALLAGIGLARRRRWSLPIVAALLLIDGGVTAFIPQLSAPRSVVVDTAPVRFLARHLDLGRYFSFADYHPNYASYFGLASLDWSDPLLPPAWYREIHTALAPNLLPAQFDGAHRFHPSDPSGVSQAVRHLQSFEAADARFFLVPDPAPWTQSRSHGLRWVFDDGFVSIFALPHAIPYFTTPGASCAIRSRGFDAVQASCPEPAVLVRSGLYLAGWSATVNQRTASVIDYHGLLTAVRLPAGLSTVRFSYTPPGLTAALVGFVVGMLLLTGIPSLRGLRRRRAPALAP